MSMFERFTDDARRAVMMARKEALRYNDDFISAAHILLGLSHDGPGAEILNGMGVKFTEVRSEIERQVERGTSTVIMGQLPFTPRAKSVLELAMEEAQNLRHNYIGTEHLVLGILRVPEGVAARTLQEMNVDLGSVRTVVGKIAPRDMSECAVEKCNNVADFEVFLYHFDSEDARVEFTRDFSCRSICQEHAKENEAQAEGASGPPGAVHYPYTNQNQESGHVIYVPLNDSMLRRLVKRFVP